MPTSIALTIAGCDPSGGAGLAADLKTFHQHQVYGAAVVTLLTVQNTRSVSQVQTLDSQFVLDQIDAVVSDIPPGAAKTGALGSAEIIAMVANKAHEFTFPLIVDPVMISKHGDALIDDGAMEVMTNRLLPTAHLVTPNRYEAEQLSGVSITDLESMKAAANRIADLGAKNVLIKSGNDVAQQIDLLWSAGQTYELTSDRIDTVHTHGTGCVLSAAITARLANGESLLAAVSGAKQFIARAIATAPGLGEGVGPINLHAPVEH